MARLSFMLFECKTNAKPMQNSDLIIWSSLLLSFYSYLGSFTLGVPTDHSCLEKSFMVYEGRLICTKTKNDAIMCIPSCKEGLLLRTGYSDKSSMVSKFPVYICNAGNLFWTDVAGNKLVLPNPRCVPKEDFLTEMLDDEKK